MRLRKEGYRTTLLAGKTIRNREGTLGQSFSESRLILSGRWRLKRDHGDHEEGKEAIGGEGWCGKEIADFGSRESGKGDHWNFWLVIQRMGRSVLPGFQDFQVEVLFERVQTAEIDSTFYAIPPKGLVFGWVRNAPENFSSLSNFQRQLRMKSNSTSLREQSLNWSSFLISSHR